MLAGAQFFDAQKRMNRNKSQAASWGKAPDWSATLAPPMEAMGEALGQAGKAMYQGGSGVSDPEDGYTVLPALAVLPEPAALSSGLYNQAQDGYDRYAYRNSAIQAADPRNRTRPFPPPKRTHFIPYPAVPHPVLTSVLNLRPTTGKRGWGVRRGANRQWSIRVCQTVGVCGQAFLAQVDDADSIPALGWDGKAALSPLSPLSPL